MGCGDKKLSKYLTQTFTAHCNAMICQQVTLSGDAEWPKVADAVIEADFLATEFPARWRYIYGPAHAVKGLSNGQTRFGTDAVIYPASW
jgi:tetrahydromethanopterin S-methyltransferase subunit C